MKNYLFIKEIYDIVTQFSMICMIVWFKFIYLFFASFFIVWYCLSVLLPAPVPSNLLPVFLLVLGTGLPAAAATLSTGSQEDEEEEGGDEDAEPEDAEHRHILQR